MNNEPLKITAPAIPGSSGIIPSLEVTGPAFFVRRQGMPGSATERIWPTNRGYLSLAQLGEAVGIKRGALQSRIQKYGCDYAGLLDPVPARRRPGSSDNQVVTKKKREPLRREPHTIPIGTWERQMLGRI